MSGHGTPIPMTSHPSGPLQGEAHVPGDKSISHRALILGAMCVGETHITGLLEGEDVLDTGKAMEAQSCSPVGHDDPNRTSCTCGWRALTGGNMRHALEDL